jgi:hypothetical protein
MEFEKFVGALTPGRDLRPHPAPPAPLRPLPKRRPLLARRCRVSATPAPIPHLEHPVALASASLRGKTMRSSATLAAREERQ